MWQVRTEDGTIFGPAAMPSLQAWARDGRLAPGHFVSSDGKTWMPVTRLPELGMHWVAEVSTGTFYGPIHRDALDELIRDGALAADVPVFSRAQPTAGAFSQEEKEALTKRLADLRQEFAKRVAELESKGMAASSEAEQLRGQLGAKDLEFEAERQEHRAALSRHQAEMAKLSARCAALEKQQAQAASRDAERIALSARLADLEKQCAAAEEQAAARRAEWEAKLLQARQAQHDAEKALLDERAARAGRAQEMQRLQEANRTLKLRQESLRKLLQQATTALGVDDTRMTDATATVIEDGVAVPIEESPPPRASLSLSELEAQAQREIRRLGSNGQNIFQRK
ncbi:MAG: hypothetical protein PHR35_08045 [Kiritimatiellae bacterium]|nr:hypothetical protein [Kiritimatiellia bacterium]